VDARNPTAQLAITNAPSEERYEQANKSHFLWILERKSGLMRILWLLCNARRVSAQIRSNS
jgi:hypothetical protein